jgi:aspartyl-tRNA(Asn)/glutamyl-tRNA(Gln) amidotransferase subunit A
MRSHLAIGNIRRQVLAPFDRFDYLLTPTMAVSPYAAELAWPPGGTAHNPFCFPFNISEQPVASVNAGFSHEGLPIGVQIVGRRFDDAGVLRAAFAFETATQHHLHRPPLCTASRHAATASVSRFTAK